MLSKPFITDMNICVSLSSVSLRKAGCLPKLLALRSLAGTSGSPMTSLQQPKVGSEGDRAIVY